MTRDTESESEPESDSRLRVRAFLHAQFTVLVAVLLVCAAVGGAAAYTAHVDPGTETRERTVSSWTVSSEYAHSAEVTRDTEVFDRGDVLRDRGTYFATVAPELDVSVETTYRAASAENVSVETESVLVIRNAGEEDAVYWEDRETLASRTATGVDPGETVRTNFTVNATALGSRIETIESQLGSAPGETEALVVTEVAVSGVVDGQSVEHVQPLELGVSPGGDTYTVSGDSRSEEIPRTATEEVERSYGPLRSIGGPLLLVVGLAGAGALAYARRTGRTGLSDAERALLDFRDDRSEFEEWITRVRLPPEATDRPEGRAESLRDLVDFAIDNEVGVVEDPATGRFHALADDCVYTYVPPTASGPAGSGTAGSAAAGSGAIGGDGVADDALADDAAAGAPPAEDGGSIAFDDGEGRDGEGRDGERDDGSAGAETDGADRDGTAAVDGDGTAGENAAVDGDGTDSEEGTVTDDEAGPADEADGGR